MSDESTVSIDITASLAEISALGLFVLAVGHSLGYLDAHDVVTRICERGHAYSVEFNTMEDIPLTLNAGDSRTLATLFALVAILAPRWFDDVPYVRDLVGRMSDSAMLNGERARMASESAPDAA